MSADILKRSAASLRSNNTPIYDITPMTMLDFHDNLACIVWFSGCSMQCSYCYNPDIVNSKTGQMSEDDLIAFLNKRIGLLDGVVLSGGECTDYRNIINLCRKIKFLGFKIKIDTNGTNPDTLSRLIDEHLIDYVALDYKAPQSKFRGITDYYAFEHFSSSLDLLINSNTPFEVRTTVHTGLLNEEDINTIISDLIARGYTGSYYLQRFIEDAVTLGETPAQNNWLDLSKIDTRLELEVRSA